MSKQHIKKQSNIKQPVKDKQDTILEDTSDRFLYVFILLAIILISFSSSFQNAFTNWDDPNYVIDNPLIRSLSPGNIKHIFSPSTFCVGNYHPITVLSLAINYNLSELNPFGYILFNILLHLLNAWLVFIITRKIFKNDIIAFICAVLFGIHPMHVEPVAWISGRKDVLFTFFYLSSLVIYLKYIEQEGKNWKLNYTVVFILFIASMLSKATAVTLPAIMFLIDFYKGRKLNSKLILEKIPFLIISVIIYFIEMKSQKAYGAVSDNISFSEMQRRFIACYGYDSIFYIIRFIFPVNLSACYPYIDSLPKTLPFIYYAAFAGIIALLLLDLYLIKKNKIIFFGLTFFLITIVTGLHFRFVSAACIADRYTYIPYIGLSFIVAYYFEKILSGDYLKKIRKTIIFIGFLVIIMFSYLTFVRCKVWKNSVILFTDVVNKYPGIPVAYNNRGNFYLENAYYDEAINDFSKAIELKPDNTGAHYNRGITYYSKGNFDAAIKDYDETIELNPNYAEAYNNRGIAYKDKSNSNEAIKNYNKAIELKPDFVEAFINRGIVYNSIDNFNAAITDYSKAIELKPDFTKAYYNRAMAYQSNGDPDNAIKDFNIIIEQIPNEPIFYQRRGECYKMKGLSKEAESDFKKYNELLKQ